MNKPCCIHFHLDDAPAVQDLPERYQARVVKTNGFDGGGSQETVLSIVIDHAFYIDFAPNILRTRSAGDKDEDPVDFPASSISFIEWFYNKQD